MGRRLGVIAVGVVLVTGTFTGAALADDGDSPLIPQPLFDTGFSLPDVQVPNVDLGDLPVDGLDPALRAPELLPEEQASPVMPRPAQRRAVPDRSQKAATDTCTVPLGVVCTLVPNSSPSATTTTATLTPIRPYRPHRWRHRFRCYDNNGSDSGSYYDGYYNGYSRGYTNGYYDGSTGTFNPSSGAYDQDGSFDDLGDNGYDVYYNRCPSTQTNRGTTTPLTPATTVPLTAIPGQASTLPQSQISGNGVPTGGVNTGDGSVGP